MRIVQKLLLSLLCLLLIAAFLLAGLFAPSQFFAWLDRTSTQESFSRRLDAMDLTLTPSDNFFERMKILDTQKLTALQEVTRGTQQTQYDVATAALRFLDAMCFYSSCTIPDEITLENTQAMLYLNEETKMTGVIWEHSIYLLKEDIWMLFMVDDITGKVIGVECRWMEVPAEYDNWAPIHLEYAMQKYLDMTLGSEIPVWTNVVSGAAYGGDSNYYESKLTIREEDSYYHYSLCRTETELVFNLPMCHSLRAMYQPKEEAIAD